MVYRVQPAQDGSYHVAQNGEVKHSFSRAEAEAVVNLLNRRTGENARARRRRRRPMQSAIPIHNRHGGYNE
jgi:hypothetical protein